MKRLVLAAVVMVGLHGAADAQTFKSRKINSGAAATADVAGSGSTMVAADFSGNFYGVAARGGDSGAGLIFKLALNSDGTWLRTTIYSFCTQPGCPDGLFPMGNIVLAGNAIYGVSESDGIYPDLVYRYDLSTGDLTPLHQFKSPRNTGLQISTVDKAGVVYGISYGWCDAFSIDGFCYYAFTITP